MRHSNTGPLILKSLLLTTVKHHLLSSSSSPSSSPLSPSSPSSPSPSTKNKITGTKSNLCPSRTIFKDSKSFSQVTFRLPVSQVWLQDRPAVCAVWLPWGTTVPPLLGHRMEGGDSTAGSHVGTLEVRQSPSWVLLLPPGLLPFPDSNAHCLFLSVWLFIWKGVGSPALSGSHYLSSPRNPITLTLLTSKENQGRRSHH